MCNCEQSSIDLPQRLFLRCFSSPKSVRLFILESIFMFHFDESSTIGFSGSRAPSIASARALQLVLAALPSDISVVVGCASGIDALVRSACPTARVFRATDYGIGRGALAARSIACVRAVAAASGVWVSLPDAACPAGLRPSAAASACFAGYGSGSWASLALALGLSVPCFVFLPSGIAVPPGWPLAALATPFSGGWYVSIPGTSQLPLFAR